MPCWSMGLFKATMYGAILVVDQVNTYISLVFGDWQWPVPFFLFGEISFFIDIVLLVLLKFWYIYVSKFEETFICKREIDALPPIIRFAVFILLTEPSRIPLFNLLAIELLMAE